MVILPYALHPLAADVRRRMHAIPQESMPDAWQAWALRWLDGTDRSYSAAVAAVDGAATAAQRDISRLAADLAMGEWPEPTFPADDPSSTWRIVEDRMIATVRAAGAIVVQELREMHPHFPDGVEVIDERAFGASLRTLDSWMDALAKRARFRSDVFVLVVGPPADAIWSGLLSDQTIVRKPLSEHLVILADGRSPFVAFVSARALLDVAQGSAAA